MRHFLRDSFVWFVDTVGIALLYRMYVRRRGPLVRVVAFHDIDDQEWFRNVIESFVSHYNVVTPQQFHGNAFDAQKINILLTFDDGYQSWVDNVLPVLDTHNIKALFFICSQLIDCAEDRVKTDSFMRERLYISPKKPLSWHGVERLLDGGHSVGGHTMTHPNLAELDKEAVQAEIAEDKERIETYTNGALVDFAYPFGRSWHFNESVRQTVRETGYTYAYTAESGFCSAEDQLEIPRLLVEKKQPLRSINRWIGGGYDIFNFLR